MIVPHRGIYTRLARWIPELSGKKLEKMVLEISVVILLTLINGALAMSELAIVSARTARLKLMADKGSKGAAIAISLAQDPGRFLSSVQVGITLIGVLKWV